MQTGRGNRRAVSCGTSPESRIDLREIFRVISIGGEVVAAAEQVVLDPGQAGLLKLRSVPEIQPSQGTDVP